MKKKAALATAMVALPFTIAPTLHAQDTLPPDRMTPIDQTVRARRSVPGLAVCCIKYSERYVKIGSSFDIVGIDDGHTIYRNARKEYFYLDPTTGDMKFLAAETFAKFREEVAKPTPGVPLQMFKWSAMKFGGQVTILGVDRAEHVVQRNARGETFYLDPNTGDMVFVK
jgi:hypothetical protein